MGNYEEKVKKLKILIDSYMDWDDTNYPSNHEKCMDAIDKFMKKNFTK